MSTPTIHGHELREEDGLEPGQIPWCCHDDMTVEPLDGGFTDYRCTTCGTLLTTDKTGSVFDISS